MKQVDCGKVELGNGVWLLLILTSGLICFGCNPTPEVPEPEPPKVTVATPVIRDVPSYSDFSGDVKAVETVEIRARVQGYLKEIHYKESLIDNEKGLMVKEGDPLFEIERDQYKTKLDEAEAAFKASEAQLVDAQANFERGENTKKIDPGALTDVQYSALLYNKDKAAAAVSSATASVRDAQINLDYTRIKAPIDGQITRSLVDKGNLVGAGEQTLLATIVSVKPIHVYFDVNERVLQKAKMDLVAAKGQVGEAQRALPKVLIGQAADGDAFPHEGELDYVDNQIKESTRTGQVRAVLPNEKGLLVSGSFARVRVEGETLKGALLIQERAIQTDLNGKYVMVVNPETDKETGAKNVVVNKYVTLGQLTDDGMRVVIVEKEDPDKKDDFEETPEEKERKKHQLKKTDKYIVLGVQRARPGMPVTPVEEAAEISSTPAEKPADKPEKKPVGEPEGDQGES